VYASPVELNPELIEQTPDRLARPGVLKEVEVRKKYKRLRALALVRSRSARRERPFTRKRRHCYDHCRY